MINYIVVEFRVRKYIFLNTLILLNPPYTHFYIGLKGTDIGDKKLVIKMRTL